MNTLERIKIEGIEVIKKLKRGEQVTAQELEVAKIYNSIYAGRSFRAGKRKEIKTGK